MELRCFGFDISCCCLCVLCLSELCVGDGVLCLSELFVCIRIKKKDFSVEFSSDSAGAEGDVEVSIFKDLHFFDLGERFWHGDFRRHACEGEGVAIRKGWNDVFQRASFEEGEYSSNGRNAHVIIITDSTYFTPAIGFEVKEARYFY